MQYGNCHVRLSGEMTNEVLMTGVTAGEILLLRRIHGDDSVLKVQAHGTDKRPHAAEFDRLKQVYGEKRVIEAFPGAHPQLPVLFRDIGIDVAAEIKAEMKNDRRAKRTKKTENAEDVAGEENDDWDGLEEVAAIGEGSNSQE